MNQKMEVLQLYYQFKMQMTDPKRSDMTRAKVLLAKVQQ
jgi:hypothetical protein